MAAKESLGNLAAETTARIVSAAADIALVVDGNAVILDTIVSRPGLMSDFANAVSWPGHAWADIVTEESRSKIKMLIDDAESDAPPKWRQLAHPAATEGDIPVLYCAVRLKKGRYLAIGRDMRAMAELQHRLVETQTSMERDYSRLRHAETRYRVLFHTTSEPVLVIDAATENVVEANPAAARLFGVSAGNVISRNFPRGFDAASTQALKSLGATVRSGQSIDHLRVRLADSNEEFAVAVQPFRQAADLLFILRLIPAESGATLPPVSAGNAKLLEFIQQSTDAYVVIDQSGRIQKANAAFNQMAQLVSEDQANGEMIERWLGRSTIDMGVMITNLRHQGAVTLFATVLRGEFGASADVEVSGFRLGSHDPSGFGLAIRSVGRRLRSVSPGQQKLPQTVEQLKELIGRVSLKEMVRESTDMIEKLCIEAALELTGDNRASAAEMLGLSRQSLYVKLRRYGMADDVSNAEGGNS